MSDELQLVGEERFDWSRVLGGGGPRCLRIACTEVGALAPLVESAVEELELNYCGVEDLAPLLRMPKLRSVRLVGNPLSPTAVAEQLPALAERLRGRGAPFVESAPPDESELCRRLWAALRLCYGRVPGNQLMLVAPAGSAPMQAAVIWAEVLAELPASREEAFARGWIDPQPDPPGERYFRRYAIADADGASQWARELGEPARAPLERFIARFGDRLFARERPIALARFERRRALQIPSSLRTQLLAVAGLAPLVSLRAQLDRFDRPGTRNDGAGQWYELGLLGSHNDDLVQLERDRCRVLPIGRSLDRDLDSTLAVRLDDDGDGRVYEYSPSALRDDERRGERADATTHSVLDSYASLLGHVRAIEVDGVTVPAKEIVHG